MAIRIAKKTEIETMTELVIETVQKDVESIAAGATVTYEPYKTLKFDEDRVLYAIEFWHGKPSGARYEGHIVVSTAPVSESGFKLSKTYPSYWAVLEDWHHHADGDSFWTTKTREMIPPLLIEKETPIYVNICLNNLNTGAALSSGDIIVRLYMGKKPS